MTIDASFTSDRNAIKLHEDQQIAQEVDDDERQQQRLIHKGVLERPQRHLRKLVPGSAKPDVPKHGVTRHNEVAPKES